MRTALTIAGSDPSGGAGIQADLKTFAAFGVYGASAITAITVQSTKGVEGVAPLEADLVTAQIEAIAGDLALHATKIGMLATSAIVEAVAAAIEELELPLVVVDPVLVSTSGARLLDDDGVQALCAALIPLARVVTPNVPEAEALSGKRIASMDDAREAARRIHGMGAGAVIITGGHAPELVEPRTPNPEPRTPNPEPRTSNPEPRTPNPEPVFSCSQPSPPRVRPGSGRGRPLSDAARRRGRRRAVEGRVHARRRRTRARRASARRQAPARC